ncbi:MAG TPA: hydrogenase maturation nickel metallochaperone HypA [Chloroflexota bacterium]|nr:hydrogenase maturation nickel metallochaperone HypA [Chloroflexota bacterium]
MHEGTLVNDLVRKVTAVAQQQNATRVTAVSVKVGDFSHVSAEHLREHFEHASRGTIAQGARFDVEAVSDTEDPNALEIVLDSVEVET